MNAKLKDFKFRLLKPDGYDDKDIITIASKHQFVRLPKKGSDKDQIKRLIAELNKGLNKVIDIVNSNEIFVDKTKSLEHILSYSISNYSSYRCMDIRYLLFIATLNDPLNEGFEVKVDWINGMNKVPHLKCNYWKLESYLYSTDNEFTAILSQIYEIF